VIEQQSLASEIPLGRTPRPGRGAVVEIHVSRPTPGQIESALAMARRVCSGLLMSSWEFENIRAWGRFSRSWDSDPEGQAIAASVTDANPATTIVSSGLYNEVPV
jgi:hypothetical protein